jgi:drug/metabolite transporter (DMT)-like permease
VDTPRGPTRPAAVGFLLLALSILLWGGGFRATAAAVDHTSPLMLSAVRTCVAAVALLVLLRALGARFPPARLWGWAALTGLLGAALFYYGIGEATERAGAAPAAVLANTAPFFVLVLGWAFLQERVTWRGIGGLVIGFAGVVVMVSSQLGEAAGAVDLVVGSALALAAALAWGITTLLVKWLLGRDPSIDLVGFTTGQHVVAGVVLAALGLGIEGVDTTRWSSGDFWGGIAFLALGGSAIAYVAFFASLRRLEAVRASAWLFLVPVVAVIIELALGNIPDGIVLVGMALAIGGVALTSVSGEPQSGSEAIVVMTAEREPPGG